ncbi:MAG: phosphate signaling complex PhoU family protein, partial [Solirubrobacteraceae bacterium]
MYETRHRFREDLRELERQTLEEIDVVVAQLDQALAALLHVIRYVERIGAQCANIAKLVPLSANEPTTDKQILETIERMGQLTRRQVTQAKDTLKTRDVALAQDLVSTDAGIGRLNRELFNRAVEIGDDIDVREGAMFIILVARALERIADNAIAIA